MLTDYLLIECKMSLIYVGMEMSLKTHSEVIRYGNLRQPCSQYIFRISVASHPDYVTFSWINV